jgi:hypothetical protein
MSSASPSISRHARSAKYNGSWVVLPDANGSQLFVGGGVHEGGRDVVGLGSQLDAQDVQGSLEPRPVQRRVGSGITRRGLPGTSAVLAGEVVRVQVELDPAEVGWV